MPIGVICDALAVAIGGVIGRLAGNKLSDEFKNKLNLVFGICSMGIGISAIVLMQNMPAYYAGMDFSRRFSYTATSSTVDTYIVEETPVRVVKDKNSISD